MTHHMHLNKLKSKIGLKFFKLKKNFEIINKIKKNYIFYSKIKKNDPLYNLFNDGFDIYPNLISEDDIKYILKKYTNIENKNNSSSYDYNLIFPFFDKYILNKILNSNIISNINNFFLKVYKVKAILQQSPLLVITKPSIENHEMSSKIKIPADYHTDYPTEMALHIPLNDLKNDMIHTIYCRSSNRDYLIKSTSKYNQQFAEKFERVKLVTKKGNGILLDTQGIHKANVKKNEIRIMLFLKFSSSSNIINNLDYSDVSTKSKESGYFTFNNFTTQSDCNYSEETSQLNSEQRKIFDYFMN